MSLRADHESENDEGDGRSKGDAQTWLNQRVIRDARTIVFFVLMDLVVKLLNEIDPPVPTLELILVRMVITYFFCVAYLLWGGVPDPFLGPKGVRRLLAIRGFCGFVGLFGAYYSLRYLSLSDATALFFLAPLCTAISGTFLLREPFHLREGLAGVLSLFGVILIARPEAIFGRASGTGASHGSSTSGQRLVAVGVALVGVLGVAGAYTSVRAIGNRAHALQSMTHLSMWCVVASSAGILVSHEEIVLPTQFGWLVLLLMMGIFGFCAQMLLTMGLQREAAGRGAMAIYVQIVFAIIFERIFFHTVPPLLSVIGILIILGSATYVAITKQPRLVVKLNANGDDDGNVDGADADLEHGTTDSETQYLLEAHEQTISYGSSSDNGKSTL